MVNFGVSFQIPETIKMGYFWFKSNKEILRKPEIRKHHAKSQGYKMVRTKYFKFVNEREYSHV